MSARLRRHLAAACAAVLLSGTAVGAAFLDPTGLFAPVTLTTLRPGTVRGLWSLAGLVVFLPVLAAACYLGVLRFGTRFARVLATAVLAAALARFAQLLAETGDPGMALWACGLTAERTALLAWIPALAATAIGPRPDGKECTATAIGPRPDGKECTALAHPLTAAGLPFAVAAPLLTPLLLDRSPAAALADGFVHGVAAAVLSVVAATAATAFLLKRAWPGWPAAIVGGAFAGVCVAVLNVADVVAAGGLAWVVGLGLHLGAGLSLGVACGWAIPLAARLPLRPALAAALALALLAWPAGYALTSGPLSGTAPVTVAARATAARELPALTVRNRTISDVNDRQVILRGANVNQLYDANPIARPVHEPVRPLTAADFAAMAALGFNVVRLDLSWSRLEPVRGRLDPGYLALVRKAVTQAADHGMYTVLDMHQDAWSRYAVGPPGTRCPSGTSPVLGYDGAPAWAVLPDGQSYCQSLDRDLTPGVQRAVTNFFHDTDGIQSALVRTWGRLAAEFAADPAVAGYDLLNEPGFGDDPPATTSTLLGRYYDRALRAIRAAESDTPGGMPHLAFLEPGVLWSGLGFDATPAPGFTDDRYTVFSPHLYNESITMDQDLGITLTTIKRGFALAERQATAYGMPLWVGEWGWFQFTTPQNAARTAQYAKAVDDALAGDAVWVWKQACGDPQAAGSTTSTGNVIGVECATGRDIPVDPATAALLSRPYPRAAPGTLTRLSARGDGPTLSLEGEAPAAEKGTRCTLDVWFPGRARPRPQSSGLSELTLRQVPGGWRITACATGGHYRLKG